MKITRIVFETAHIRSEEYCTKYKDNFTRGSNSIFWLFIYSCDCLLEVCMCTIRKTSSFFQIADDYEESPMRWGGGGGILEGVGRDSNPRTLPNLSFHSKFLITQPFKYRT